MNAAPTSAIIPTRGANAPNKAVAPAATAPDTPAPPASAVDIASTAIVTCGNAVPNACMMLVSVFAPSIPFIADSFQRQYRVV